MRGPPMNVNRVCTLADMYDTFAIRALADRYSGQELERSLCDEGSINSIPYDRNLLPHASAKVAKIRIAGISSPKMAP
jgi:hypothetical protein